MRVRVRVRARVRVRVRIRVRVRVRVRGRVRARARARAWASWRLLRGERHLEHHEIAALHTRLRQGLARAEVVDVVRPLVRGRGRVGVGVDVVRPLREDGP